MTSGRDLYGKTIRSRTMPDLSGTAYGVVPHLRNNIERTLETLPLPNGRQNNTNEPVARAHETDWQMGPQFKDKPGSQGTLFSGGTKHSSDARFPRGYTPERLHDVADAIVPTTMSLSKTGDGGIRRGTQSRDYKDISYPTAPHLNESRQPLRRIVDNVARSTIPVEDLGGQLTVHSKSLGGSGGFDTHAGEYHAFVGHPEIHIHPGMEENTTPIHEIGHHVSKQQGTDHSDYYSHEERGQEEAFADNYADKHFRDRKGQPVSTARTYAGGQVDDIRTPAFYHAYEGVRDRSGKPREGALRPLTPDLDLDARTHPDGSKDVPLLRKSYRMSEVQDKHGNPYFDEHTGIDSVHEDALPFGVSNEDVLPKHMADQRWITQDHKYDGYKRGLPVQEKQFGRGDLGPGLTTAIKGLFEESRTTRS